MYLKREMMYSKTPLYCPSIHHQTRVSPKISAVPFSVCNNNPVKIPNSHTAIHNGNLGVKPVIQPELRTYTKVT